MSRRGPRDVAVNRQTIRTIITIIILVVALVSYLLKEQERQRPPPPTGPADVPSPLALGNPSGATDDPANADNYLMRKPFFALSYNNGKGTPNWVSWSLTAADVGPAPRAEFFPDEELPRAFKHVVPRDYTNSGFDRGHLCPRSDRSSTPEAARSTFVMTNIMPQAPSCNQKAWADLEEYCRDQAVKKRQTLYIVAGPQGQGGTGTNGPADAIGKGKVTVPARCWKVVLALDAGPAGPDDVGRAGRHTRLFAVVFPNDESVGHGWGKYRASVREVESLTGYRFFDKVPAAVLDPLKAQVDQEPIPAGAPHGKEGERGDK